MVVGLIYRCIHLCIVFNISIIFAVLTVFRIAILLVTKGPRKMFERSKRDKEPECLGNKNLGTHGYLYLEDVRIHYVNNGSDDKPLMLLLHGFPESWYSWRFQLQHFNKDYRVAAVDLRGYGDSDKPSGISQYKIEHLVKDIKQIITALGYRSCVLVGHDWGGAISWAFAGTYPDMVDKVIILNSPHPQSFYKYLLSHWEQFKKSWYMFFFLIPVLPEIYISLSDMKFFDIIFLGKKGGVLTGATTRDDVEAYKYLFQKFGSLTGPINYIRASVIFGVPKRFHKKVTKPVLLIWGCRDLAIEKGQAEACQAYAENLTIRYLENASHWVQMDDPNKVNELIKEFISP